MVRLVPNWIKTLMSEDFDLLTLWDNKETDVFLIYKTPYDQNSFGDSVYLDLHHRKINIYRYKETRGTATEQWNSYNVNQAIQQSKIIIIIFDKDFDKSSDLLDLLAHIINNPAHYFKIIPVFNGVDRSDVEDQTRDFAELFPLDQPDNGENMRKVANWNEALKQVSILPSWKLENNFINVILVLNEIRDVVSNKVGRMALNRSCLRGFRNFYATAVSDGVTYMLPPYDSSVRDCNRDLAPCRVPLLNEDGIGNGIYGLNSRLKEVLSQMQFKHDQVLFVAIRGDPGIGKTILAQKIHDMIADRFDASCFIPHVRENSRKHGLERLQDKLLSELTEVTHTKINNVIQGIAALYYHLRQRKVLLTLDDVGDQADQAKRQLKALANLSFLGPGSIVIITTTILNVLEVYVGQRENDHPHKKQVLTEYVVPPLNDNVALELLQFHAFRQGVPDPNKADVMNSLVNVSLKNPMNLKQIGIRLYGKPVEFCRAVLREIEEADTVVDWVANIIGPPELERQPQQGGVITVLRYLETLGTKFCKLIPSWKIFGSLSSIVWFLCYALNPSVKRLIKEWNAWKILLYVMIVLYVFFNVFLMSKDRLKTIYLRNQVSSGVALCLTAIYTHYYEEAVDENPGILDIVSNFALACISLSLSRRLERREFSLFGACLGNLVIQVLTMDKRFIIFVIIGGIILFCMNSSPTQFPHFRNAGTRPHQD